MCGRGCCQDIGDKAFIVPLQREVHLPPVFRAPVPVEHILPVEVPVPLHLTPELVDLLCQRFLLFIAIFKIFPHNEQPLHQESALHKVPTVILCAEWFGFSRGAMNPVRPDTMKPIGGCQIIGYFVQPCHTIDTRNKSSFNASNKSGNAEAATTGGHHVGIILRILTVHMDAFRRKPRCRFSSIPHVVEMRFLDEVEKSVVSGELGRSITVFLLTFRFCLFVLVAGSERQ